MSAAQGTKPQPTRRGPTCAEELARWPEQWVAAVKGGKYRRRLMSFAKRGFLGLSDFSGMDCHMEGWRMMSPVLAAALQLPGIQYVHARSCDWGRLQQEVLVKCSEAFDAGRSCVFDCIESQFDSVAQEQLQTMSSTEGPWNKQDANVAEKRNEDGREWLRLNAKWACPLDKMGY